MNCAKISFDSILILIDAFNIVLKFKGWRKLLIDEKINRKGKKSFSLNIIFKYEIKRYHVILYIYYTIFNLILVVNILLIYNWLQR